MVNSCRLYMVLFVIALSIIIAIISEFLYFFFWHLKRSNTNVVTNVNPNTEIVIY